MSEISKPGDDHDRQRRDGSPVNAFRRSLRSDFAIAAMSALVLAVDAP